jgi:glycosyltransferase involved in cell wall biosynthesis
MLTSSVTGSLPARLLCLSHLRWNFVFQRPQHLMTRAARDYDVIFLEEPVYESSDIHELRIYEPEKNLRVVTPVLPGGLSQEAETASIRRMLDRLLKSQRVSHTVAWYYSPMALAFTHHLSPDLCVYDCMDELSAFRSAPKALTVMERWLFSRADLVFTGGFSLYEAKRHQHRDVHAFPSSIDAKHFARATAANVEEPSDQRPIDRPRVGFFGVIDERMDLALVDGLAKLRPDWQLVMLGPVVKIDPASLPRRQNIHWLGGKTYNELPAYLAGWDAGIMPFAMNEATRFISPTKTPEFLAAGVPVVSTPIRDVVRPYGEKGLVEIASTPEQFAKKIDVLMARPDAPWLAQVKKQLATTSWDATWSSMQQLMASRLEGLVPEPSKVASETTAARSFANV